MVNLILVICATILACCDSLVLYFAYGSNMNSSVMKGRRALDPISQTPAFCAGHRLAFSALGFPPLEPSFASIEPSTIKNLCHGVLYDLNQLDWLKLCASEGVPFAYQIIAVEVRPYAPNEDTWSSSTVPTVKAFTLRARQPQTILFGVKPIELVPSRRYMGLLRQGAKEAGLATSWKDYLNSLPPK
jgi:hypothetical protein